MVVSVCFGEVYRRFGREEVSEGVLWEGEEED